MATKLIEVSKNQFKEMYFKYTQPNDGWGQSYWDQFFENDPRMGMKYFIEHPISPAHNRIMIVYDQPLSQYRLFLVTEDY